MATARDSLEVCKSLSCMGSKSPCGHHNFFANSVTWSRCSSLSPKFLTVKPLTPQYAPAPKPEAAGQNPQVQITDSFAQFQVVVLSCSDKRSSLATATDVRRTAWVGSGKRDVRDMKNGKADSHSALVAAAFEWVKVKDSPWNRHIGQR